MCRKTPKTEVIHNIINTEKTLTRSQKCIIKIIYHFVSITIVYIPIKSVSDGIIGREIIIIL